MLQKRDEFNKNAYKSVIKVWKTIAKMWFLEYRLIEIAMLK